MNVPELNASTTSAMTFTLFKGYCTAENRTRPVAYFQDGLVRAWGRLLEVAVR